MAVAVDAGAAEETALTRSISTARGRFTSLSLSTSTIAAAEAITGAAEAAEADTELLSQHPSCRRKSKHRNHTATKLLLK